MRSRNWIKDMGRGGGLFLLVTLPLFEAEKTAYAA